MVNINFVPDDYIQSSESRRTNLMCLILFAVVMAGMGGSFATIKIRQRIRFDEERRINAEMAQQEKAIQEFEQLQIKHKEMMKMALVTYQLLEPVPRSVLLASLTNNLPPGVSLLKVDVIQKQPKRTSTPAPVSKYEAAKAEQETTLFPISPEKLLETSIEIGGIAPSDLQVATYIERLSTSSLLDSVALVESKEFKIDDTTFRRFKLNAALRKEVHLTKEDVDKIKAGFDQTTNIF